MKWFKMHTDSSTLSPYMSLVEDRFGLEGYARMIKLKEAIASQMLVKESDALVEYPERKWCQILKCKKKGLDEFLSFLSNKGIIFLQRTENGLEVTFDKLRDSLDNRAASSSLREPSNDPNKNKTNLDKEEEPEQLEANRDGMGSFFKKFNQTLKSSSLKTDLRCLIVQSAYDGELTLDQLEVVIDKVKRHFDKKPSEKAQRYGLAIISEIIKLKKILEVELTKPNAIRGSQSIVNAVLESFKLPLDEDAAFLISKRRLKTPDATSDDISYVRLRYKTKNGEIPDWMSKYEKKMEETMLKRRLLSH